MRSVPRIAWVPVAVVSVALLASAHATASLQPPPDLDAFARQVREAIRLEYAQPVRFNYKEHGPDVDISTFGKISVGPVKTFEVRQNPPGEAWRRLIAIDGKPLDASELARQDAEHREEVSRRLVREKTESAKQRDSRERQQRDELHERDEILDDATRVFAFSYVGRDTIDNQPVIVVDLTPRANARVTTSEGQRMKRFAGRMWVSERDHRIARVRLHATDSVSVGWGIVARVEPGSGFEFIRKRVGDAWVASELTIEGSGSTLMLRKFRIKTVTTYTDHRPYAQTVNE